MFLCGSLSLGFLIILFISNLICFHQSNNQYLQILSLIKFQCFTLILYFRLLINSNIPVDSTQVSPNCYFTTVLHLGALLNSLHPWSCMFIMIPPKKKKKIQIISCIPETIQPKLVSYLTHNNIKPYYLKIQMFIALCFMKITNP